MVVRSYLCFDMWKRPMTAETLGGMWFDHVKKMVIHTFSGSRCVYPLDDRRNNNVMWWLNYSDYSFLKSYSLLCSLPLDPFGIKNVDSTLLSCIAICWYYGIHPNWIDHWINSHVYYVHMSNFRYLSLSLYIIYRRNIFVIIYIFIYTCFCCQGFSVGQYPNL